MKTGEARENAKLVDDMTAFLKQQPNNELKGIEMVKFYEVFPEHRGMFKLKNLATSNECFRWIPHSNPTLIKIALAEFGFDAPQRGSSLSEDLFAFLKQQPNHELLADRSHLFFRAYPQHQRKVKLKKFVDQSEIFCWRPHQNPSMQVITLAPSMMPGSLDRKNHESKNAVFDVAESKTSNIDILHGRKICFVNSAEKLASVSRLPPFCSGGDKDMMLVAIDCEGVPEALDLIQVAPSGGKEVFVFDCLTLGPEVVCGALRELLRSNTVTKLFHDVHKDSAALGSIGGVAVMQGTLDTQLAMELLTGRQLVGFNEMLSYFKVAQHPKKKSMQSQMNADGNKMMFRKRPMDAHVLEYAALDVALLVDVAEALKESLGGNLVSVQRASDSRALFSRLNQGSRQVCFDKSNNYALASFELLSFTRPDDIERLGDINISDDTNVLLQLLPSAWAARIPKYTDKLSEVVVDLGRPPYAWIGGDRFFLSDEFAGIEEPGRVVTTRQDLDSILNRVGEFGTDNRAGLERQLHRISAFRNRSGDVIGLTMRVGRHIGGCADMILDLLFADPTRSVLFLGEPGSGKTTIVREVTRILAERENVCIVDTSNEIAGDGDVPHPCVGHARRLMVPSLNHQADVMIECVQNHAPHTIVIDEIGRKAEVQAAQTCKQRGVRLIASAHGDLRKLVRNPELRGLIGGVEHVTLGDGEAKREQERRSKVQESSSLSVGLQKVRAQRAGAPTFEIVVELSRASQSEWRIVSDVARAVDSILDGDKYKSQVRTRKYALSSFQVELEQR